jgi:hypothetical protein
VSCASSLTSEFFKGTGKWGLRGSGYAPFGGQNRMAVLPLSGAPEARRTRGSIKRTCPYLGGGGRPRSGLETGGRDGEAAVCRRPYGNSAPLLNEQ